MIQPVVILFVIVSMVFALVHWVAVEFSLYWHYWWFDILMHFWGGLLLALGTVAFTTFRRIHLKPSYKLVLGVSLVAVLTWEFFEWQIGLFVPSIHLPDAIYDMTLGVTGGLLGYFILKRFKI